MISKFKSIRNNKGFIKYFTNTSWLLGEKILRMTVGLFIGIWVARYLGPGQFGLFSYAQSFAGLFTAIATLGLDSIIIRELVKDESKRDILLGTSFILKIIGAFLVMLILFVAINFTDNDTYTNILIYIIASSTIFQSFNVIDFYFQSKVLSRYVVYANVISLSISSIVKIVLLLNNAPLLAFVLIILFDSIILALGFLYFYFHNKLSTKNWKFSIDTARNLLTHSWPLILSGIIISLYMKIDQIMIKDMINDEAVGYYTAALKLSEAWYFIPIVIVNSLFPAIIKSKKNIQEYNNRMQALYMFLMMVTIPIAIIVTLSNEYIINFLYGKQFADASAVLEIHIWTSTIVALGVAYNAWLINENYMKKTFYRAFSGMLVNIYLNYLLIPIYGILGAAYASFLSYLFADIIYDVFDKDTHLPLKQKLYAILFFYKFKGIK